MHVKAERSLPERGDRPGGQCAVVGNRYSVGWN
jgi:hypothetical protein